MDRDKGVRSWLKRTDIPPQTGGVPADSDTPTLWPQVDANRGPHDEPGKPIPRTSDTETSPSEEKSGTL